MLFLISRIRFLYIKNLISWYQEITHIAWYKKNRMPYIKKSFLISRNRFFFISRYQIFGIKKFLINSKSVPRNICLYIKKSNSLYQEIDFLISKNSIYEKMKFISWYQEMELLISRNAEQMAKRRFMDMFQIWWFCHNS